MRNAFLDMKVFSVENDQKLRKNSDIFFRGKIPEKNEIAKLDQIHSVPQPACSLDNSKSFDVAFVTYYYLNSVAIPILA